MPKNWEKTGYLIPANINPEENICICVPIPKDWGHIRAFMGQMTELSKWITWEKTGDDKAAQAARRWFEITECLQEAIDCAMTDGCGCGSSAKPTNTRINPETGIYEESYDGGITWIPAPQLDPRSSGVVFPPIPGDPGNETRCAGSNSVVTFLKSMQDVEHDQLTANATIADAIIAVLAALSALSIFLAYVPAAVFALVAFVVGTFGHMIAEDFDEAFTEETWDDLLCIVYCSIREDASFREADWLHVKNEAVAKIGGYAGQWIADHVNLIGVVGLTNAARSSSGGNESCDSCECGTCINEANIIVGTLRSIDGNTIEIDSVEATRNGITAHWVAYGSDDDEFCCLLCAQSYHDFVLSGGWTDCEGTPQPTTSPVGEMVRSTEWYSSVPFYGRITFADINGCPPEEP